MSLLARYALPADLPESEREALRDAHEAAFDGRFLEATRLGALASAIASVGCLLAWPETWAIWGMGAAVLLGGSLLAIRGAASRLRRGFIERFNLLLGAIAAAVTGEAASHALGVASAGVLVLLVLWLYGTVVLGMRPTQLVLAVLCDGAAYAAPSLLRGRTEGFALFCALVVGAGAVFAVAALERRAVETRMFLTRRRKEQTNSRLADRAARLAAWSTELERRVDVQLASVLEKRRQVEMLERAVGEAERPLGLPDAPPSLDVVRTRMLPPGYLLGSRARLVRPLASGGFGDVYLAEDLVTGSEVVAKVMRCDAETDALRKKRFVLEASAANAVSHRSVVRVLHVDVSPEGWPYLLSERVDGVTLRWCIQADALQPVHYFAALLAAAHALAAIHEAGVVHRDIKPDNLMLQSEAPGLKILDFGVSRWAESDDHDLTEAGELLGTVAYMAPEQIADGSVVTPAADVYALGLTMFECLAGDHPLTGLSFTRMMEAHLRGDLPSLQSRAPLLDARAVRLVDEMLQRRPARRPSVAEVCRRLGELVPAGQTAEGAYASLELGSLRARASLPGGDGADTLRRRLAGASEVPTVG